MHLYSLLKYRMSLEPLHAACMYNLSVNNRLKCALKCVRIVHSKFCWSAFNLTLSFKMNAFTWSCMASAMSCHCIGSGTDLFGLRVMHHTRRLSLEAIVCLPESTACEKCLTNVPVTTITCAEKYVLLQHTIIARRIVCWPMGFPFGCNKVTLPFAG